MDRYARSALIILLLASFAIACNTSGLSKAPRATFSQLACLDVNGDDRIDDADAADPSKLPDFNADRKRDDSDAAFLRGTSIPLDPNRTPCDDKDSERAAEYLVAHGYLAPSNVSCGGDAKPVLLVGIGGGAVNLREKEDVAGIRSLIDALQREYDDNGVETIGVLAGPSVVGAEEIHGAMEDWLTNVVRVYLDRYPCIRVVLAGHSHGAITGDVIAARLESAYAGRIIAVVDVDRVETLYTGDLASRPQTAPVLNVYETNDGILPGRPFEGANVENWDASAITGPEGGQHGGAQKPVTHTTIDNSRAVRDRIVEEVMERNE